MISLTVQCASCASRASVEFDELAPGEALWVCPSCGRTHPMGVCGRLLSIRKLDFPGPNDSLPGKFEPRR